jgi:hypothetical protein
VTQRVSEIIVGAVFVGPGKGATRSAQHRHPWKITVTVDVTFLKETGNLDKMPFAPLVDTVGFPFLRRLL